MDNTTPTSFVCKKSLTSQSELASFNDHGPMGLNSCQRWQLLYKLSSVVMRPLASWEKKNATWHAKTPDANWLIPGLGMILYNPLQTRNDDRSLFFFWLGITTVDGSDIRRSAPWDVSKTLPWLTKTEKLPVPQLLPDFWTTNSMNQPGFTSFHQPQSNSSDYEIAFFWHGITINQPRFTSFHNLLWLGKFVMSICQPSGCTEVATTTDGLTIQPCGHGGASIHGGKMMGEASETFPLNV